MAMRKFVIVDAIALVVYVIVANPAFTGVPFHEWAGIGVFLVFLVHTAQHLDVAADMVRGSFSAKKPHRAWNVVLDVLIVVAFMVCTVSGLLISGSVLPALGLFADGYFFWNPLHAASAKLLLALLAVHVVVHLRMVFSLLKSGKDSAGASKE